MQLLCSMHQTEANKKATNLNQEIFGVIGGKDDMFLMQINDKELTFKKAYCFSQAPIFGGRHKTKILSEFDDFLYFH